jgi:tetratricopeptide (TPR) repeat protein
MKKINLLLVVLAFVACNSKQSPDYKKLYSHAMEIKDYQTAITAIQIMYQLDSTDNALLDTLPELYIAQRNFESADYYTQIALKKYPDNEHFLQIKALMAQQFGRVEEEMDTYEKLYAKTQKLSYLYQLTAFYFSAGQMEPATKGLTELEAKMANSTDSVDFMVSETAKQKVPVRAAVYNMKAYLQAQKRDLAGAKNYFEMALKEYPEFVTAKQNLMQLMGGRR